MFIIKINNEYDMDSGMLSRLVRIHKTPNEDVAILYTDDPMPNGFAVLHADMLATDLAKAIKDTEVLDKGFEAIVARQKREIRREARLARQRRSGKV